MTTLGVFRDDFYNAISVLASGQFNATAQGNGTVLVAASIASAQENYVSSSGATALTTDSAANIIASLQTCLTAQMAAAVKAGAANIPPPGVPNLNNLSFFLFVRNTNGGTLTLTAGAGVTITGLATIATTVERQYQVTVTGPNTVTFQDLGGAAVT